MARLQFGTTWWGRRWLEVFAGEADAARAGRGRASCGSGGVKDLAFDAETLTVSAEIRAAGTRPCRAWVRLPAMDARKAGKLAREVAARPHLVAGFLEHRLEPEAEELARACGAPLFPSDASEIASSCSCTDEASPCRHVLALYYSVIRMIDADPLEIFRLRGVDFPALLKKAGADLGAAERRAFLTSRSLLAWRPAEAASLEGDGTASDFSAVPLYRLEPMAESLVSLLAEETPLFPGGRVWLSRTWNRIAKKAASLWQSRGSKKDAWVFIDRGPLGSCGPVIPRIGFFGDGLDFIRPVAPGTPRRALSERRSSGWLFDALAAIGREEAEAHSAGLAAWEQTMTVALALMRAGAIVPVLLRHEREEGAAFTLAWQPALASATVREIVIRGAAALEAPAARMLELPEGCESTREGRFLAVLTVLLTSLADHLQEGAPAARMKLVPGLFLDRYRCLEEGACDAEIQSLERYLKPLSFYQKPSAWKPAVTVRLAKSGEIALNLGVVPNGAAKAGRPVLLSKILEEEAFAAVRYGLVADFKVLADSYAPLKKVVESGGLSSRIEPDALKDFLFSARPALELLGAVVLLPRRLRKILKPSLQARISGAGAASGRFITKEMLSEFSWSAAVGDKVLTEAEFRELAQKRGEIVQVGEDYVWLDPEEIAKIEKRLASKKAPGYLERLRAVLTGTIDGARVCASDDILEGLRSMNREEDVPVPAALQATLRPYQKRGYAWLVKNLRLGLGSLIADDMGLGKTVQVIAAVAWLKEQGELARAKAIAVVPATLLVNWEREIRRFAPSLSAAVYHGPARRVPDESAMPDVLITTYGTLRRDAERLSERKWRLMILDEAQAVKNTATGAYAAASAFPAKQAIAMTGTPVENRLMEYWAIFSIIQPGVLGTASEFRSSFEIPIESEHDPEVSEAFRRLAAPFMLRRVKTDKSVISDLPDRLVQDVPTSLLPEQAALYEATLRRSISEIEGAEAEGAKGGARRKALVLKLITELKQVCNSPSQFLKTRAPEPDSAKAQALLELLDECRANRRKAIVFTQYREMGERLQDWIGAKFGRRPEFLHGGVTVPRRSAMVDEFQTSPDAQVLIVSLKAGGVGLNLTAASVVIHYDLWWNPAVENQASDRAWRIGQRKDVLILRFVTEGTFEERINELLTEKRRLAELAVGTGEKWIGDMTAGQIRDLFRLGGSHPED